MPEAMVAYLDNHGPEKFATIFLGKSKVMFFYQVRKVRYIVFYSEGRGEVFCPQKCLMMCL